MSSHVFFSSLKIAHVFQRASVYHKETTFAASRRVFWALIASKMNSLPLPKNPCPRISAFLASGVHPEDKFAATPLLYFPLLPPLFFSFFFLPFSLHSHTLSSHSSPTPLYGAPVTGFQLQGLGERFNCCVLGGKNSASGDGNYFEVFCERLC